MNIENSEHRYIISRYMYSINNEIMNDSEYSILDKYIKANNLLPEYTSRSWSSDPCPTDLLHLYKMEKYINNIVLDDKTESIPSITNMEEVRETFFRPKFKYGVLSYKYNGWNIRVDYYNGKLVSIRTRGRVGDFIKADKLKGLVPNEIPILGKVRVAGEFVLSWTNFRELKKLYPNNVAPRSSISTLVADSRVTNLGNIKMFSLVQDGKNISYPLQLIKLKEMGFDTIEYKVIRSFEELVNTVKEFSDNKEAVDLDTDGLVFRDNEGNSRAIRVMAWEEEIYKSYVIGYIEEQGTQVNSIQIQIRPVKINGVGRQKQIPITNLDRIIENKLYPGHPICFKVKSASNCVVDTVATKLTRETYYDLELYKIIVDAEEEAKDLY